MGTRGFMGLVIDGQAKIGYVHWDSYPEGLGASTLEALRTLLLADSGDQVATLALDTDLDASMGVAGFNDLARTVVTAAWPHILREAADILEGTCSGCCTRKQGIEQLRRLADQSERFQTPRPAAFGLDQDGSGNA